MILSSELVFSFDKTNTFSFPEVKCKAGESLVILGPSGCGKSTFLYLLSGLLKPNSGNIFIGDTNLQSLSKKQLDKFRANNYGLIFQNAYFYKALNVKQNLEMCYRLSDNIIDENRVQELTKRLSLSHKLKSKITELSSGELQRLSLIRAILLKPKIILADEPTSALDDKNAQTTIQLLTELSQENNSSLIIVTHDHRISSVMNNRIILA